MIRSWSRGEDEEGQEDDDYNGKVKANGNGDGDGNGKERGKGRPAKKSLGTYIGTLPPVLRYRFPFNYVSYSPHRSHPALQHLPSYS